MMRVAALVLVLSALPTAADEGTSVANPVRKVVDMLQMMQKKVAAEGEKEQKLFDKFQCYCKNSGGDLQASITAGDTKVPRVEAAIGEAEAKKNQLTEELKQHRADRDAAKATMAEATALREKEAAEYAKTKSDYDANIQALAKAILAVDKGMAGGFLQTSGARALRRLVQARQDMPETERQDIIAFLAGSHGSGYAPQAGEVSGILKQLNDGMGAELADIIAKEEAAIKAHAELMTAKKKQVSVLSASIEEKMERTAKLGVDLANMNNDLEDTQEALAADQQFLADMSKSCATKAAEWEERKKVRAEELLAIAETIKVLNDDDALELFKRTLPSAGSSSLVQVKANRRAVTKKALRALDRLPRSGSLGARPALDFLSLAIGGKKMSFEKVIKMIDNMVVTLKTEQTDDDQKRDYCAKEFDGADDKKKGLDRAVAGLETAIAEAKDDLATVKAEVKALEEAIKALDKQVAEATEQRKEEHSDYTELIAQDAAAKRLLGFAKNRLNKFYNPALYKPPPERDLTEAERITVNLGGDVPTAAPGGIAGTGIAVLTQLARHRDAPPPPPETFGAYTKQGEKNTGVIAMIDLLIQDLDKDTTEAKTAEEHAQADYQGMMKDSAEKRSQDSKSVAQKMSTKAGLEADLAEHADSKASTGNELVATLKYISSLHAECDWLVQYFDVRKEARATEVDQLKQAKAILSGADFSML